MDELTVRNAYETASTVDNYHYARDIIQNAITWGMSYTLV